MGDLIALAFTLFIIGTVAGGFKLGGYFVGVLVRTACWIVAVVVVAYVVVLANYAIIIGGAIIAGLIIVAVRALRSRRQRYDCRNCCHNLYCSRDCRGTEYTPIYPRNRRR